MQDLWNIPDNVPRTDILTARVAAGIRYALALMRYWNGQSDGLRKDIIHSLGINKDTLQVYLTPILDHRHRIVSGPTKMAIFHGIVHHLGLRVSQFYAAAEDSVSKEDFIQRINLIVLNDRAETPSAAFIGQTQLTEQSPARWS